MSLSKDHLQKIQLKKRDKGEKNVKLRRATVNEIIFIFEKVLEGWKSIKIYNVLIQNNPQSLILKEDVEHIYTGNCKVYEFEEKFEIYQDLRQKVYAHHSSSKT